MQRSSIAGLVVIGALLAVSTLSVSFAAQSDPGARVAPAPQAQTTEIQAANTHICVVTMVRQRSNGQAPLVDRICITGSTQDRCNANPGGYCDPSPPVPGMTQSCAWVDARVCGQGR